MVPRRLVRAWRLEHYADLAAILFAIQGIFAVLHRALGREYSGYTHSTNVFFDTLYAILWLACAAACLVRRSSAAWVIAWLGMYASLYFGIMFSVATANMVGLPFLVAAGLIAFCLSRSLRVWRIRPARRDQEAKSFFSSARLRSLRRPS